MRWAGTELPYEADVSRNGWAAQALHGRLMVALSAA